MISSSRTGLQDLDRSSSRLLDLAPNAAHCLDLRVHVLVHLEVGAEHVLHEGCVAEDLEGPNAAKQHVWCPSGSPTSFSFFFTSKLGAASKTLGLLKVEFKELEGLLPCHRP